MSRPFNKEDQLKRIILLNSFKDSSGHVYVSQNGTVSTKSEKEFKILMNRLLSDTTVRTITPEFRMTLQSINLNPTDFGFVLNDTPREEYIKEYINNNKNFSFGAGYESLESYINTVMQNISGEQQTLPEPKKESGVDTSLAKVINPDLELSENVELEQVLQERVVQDLVQQRADYLQAKSDMAQGLPIKDSALNPEPIETPVVGNKPTQQLSVVDIATQADTVASSLPSVSTPASMPSAPSDSMSASMPSAPAASSSVPSSIDSSNITTIPDSVGPPGVSVVSDSNLPQQTSQDSEDPAKPMGQAAQIIEPYMNNFHKSSVLLFLGSPPVFDSELNNTIDSLQLKPNEANEMMDSIIKSSGDKILVSKRESNGNKEELRVLLQLHFCVLRNLARGDRTKMALVPLSSLIDLRNTAANTNVQDPFVEAANMDGGVEGGITQSAPLPSNDPLMHNSKVQKSLETKIEFDDVVKAYRNREYTKTGKALLKTKYGQLTKQSFQNQNQLDIIGSSSTNDPMGERYLTAKNKIQPNQIRYRNI